MNRNRFGIVSSFAAAAAVVGLVGVGSAAQADPTHHEIHKAIVHHRMAVHHRVAAARHRAAVHRAIVHHEIHHEMVKHEMHHH